MNFVSFWTSCILLKITCFNPLKSSGNYISTYLAVFRIYGFCMILGVYSNYFLRQHLYSWPLYCCFLWGTDWVLKYRFQVLTVASMKMTAFWDIVPCSLIEVYRSFGREYCFHHQGDDDPSKIPSDPTDSYTSSWFFSRTAYSSPRWLRQYAPLKRRSISTKLQGATSQKNVIVGFLNIM
jgi:hypothetical protein